MTDTNDQPTYETIWSKHRVSDAGEAVIVEVRKQVGREYYHLRQHIDGRLNTEFLTPDRQDALAAAEKYTKLQTHKEWCGEQNSWVESFPPEKRDDASEYQNISVSLMVAEHSDNPADRDQIPTYKQRLAELTEKLGIGVKNKDDLSSDDEQPGSPNAIAGGSR